MAMPINPPLAYNPVSYHNGSVWPHDNALIVAGLMRYGFVKEAQQLAVALMEAAEFTDHRLPELFCGFSRSNYPEPLPYPTECPAGVGRYEPGHVDPEPPVHDAHFSLGELWMDPVLPEAWGNFHAENVALGETYFSCDVFGSQMKVEGLTEGIVLRRGTRPTLADVQGRERPRWTE